MTQRLGNHHQPSSVGEDTTDLAVGTASWEVLLLVLELLPDTSLSFMMFANFQIVQVPTFTVVSAAPSPELVNNLFVSHGAR